MNKIYVLSVGINDYTPPVGKLRGCLNDVDALKSSICQDTDDCIPVFFIVFQVLDSFKNLHYAIKNIAVIIHNIFLKCCQKIFYGIKILGE